MNSLAEFLHFTRSSTDGLHSRRDIRPSGKAIIKIANKNLLVYIF